MQRTIPLFAVLLATAALCSSDTAQAPTITVGQSRIYLFAPPGGMSQVEALSVSANSLPLRYRISTIASDGWLGVSSREGNLPATILASANATLLQNGVYYETITISAPDNPSVQPVTVQVILYVGASSSSAISASPGRLVFEAQSYGLPAAAQSLAIKGLARNVSFFVTTATADGNPWLQVNPLNGTTPQSLAVTADPGVLAAGDYRGTITITPLQGSPVVVDVSFLVTGSNVVQVTPAALQFYHQTGKPNPNGQRLDFKAVDSPVSVTLKASTSSGGAWLSLTPTALTTPYSSFVTVTPGNLPPGEYHGSITVIAQGASTPAFIVPVTLTIGAGPLLTVSGSLSPFNYELGGAAPAGQTIAVGSTSTPLKFTVTTSTSDGGEWLMAGPLSGVTPASLLVGINTGDLKPGTYSGTISVSSSDAVNESQTVHVSLTVTGAQAVDVSPGSLYFAYQIGGSNMPPTQTISITSSGGPVSVWATPSMADCNAAWLQVWPGSSVTPAEIAVSVNTDSLASPQICNGSVTISGPEIAGATRLPVTLVVSTQPLLNVSPAQIRMTAPYGGALSGQNGISLTTTNNSSIPFTAVASTSNGGTGWLTVSPRTGNAPATLTAALDTRSLTPGTYSGAVAIHSPGLAMPITVPVVLTITPVSSLAASPASLSFSQTQGGPQPASRQVSITTDGAAVAYTASAVTTAGSGWLSVTASTRATPGTITVAANAVPGMTPGAYSGYVLIEAPAARNAPYRIPVTFVVNAPPVSLSPAPQSLSFAHQRGSATNPDAQKLRITASGAAAVNFTAAAVMESGGEWLSVTPAAAATPSDLTVSVNPSGLDAGTYTCRITITPAGGAAPISIPVSLVVSPPPAPAIAAVVNAATGKAGDASPGEIITIAGQALGPAPGIGHHIGENGKLDTRVGSVRVLFDGIEAPLLWVSAAQINAIVPYEMAGRPNAAIVVERDGVASPVMTVAIAPSAPGIFTMSKGGAGQAAALNQDNTYNGASTPAARGSVIQLFATGEGQTDPTGVTGAVMGMDVCKPLLKVTASIGGAPAPVEYAGSAPLAPAGLFQVNVRIPDDAPAGEVPIVITVGEASSQSGVTIAVK
jgi:uncharacterized protein (TIGR03437 family)